MMIKPLPLYFSPLILINLVLVLISSIYAFIEVHKLRKLNQVSNKDLIFSFFFSLTLYAILKLIFHGENEELYMILLGPMVVNILPLILHFVTRNMKKIKIISKISLLSIIFTFIGIGLKILLSNIS